MVSINTVLSSWGNMRKKYTTAELTALSLFSSTVLLTIICCDKVMNLGSSLLVKDRDWQGFPFTSSHDTVTGRTFQSGVFDGSNVSFCNEMWCCRQNSEYVYKTQRRSIENKHSIYCLCIVWIQFASKGINKWSHSASCVLSSLLKVTNVANSNPWISFTLAIRDYWLLDWSNKWMTIVTKIISQCEKNFPKHEHSPPTSCNLARGKEACHAVWNAPTNQTIRT